MQRHVNLLDHHTSAFLVVDLQGKLFENVFEKTKVEKNVCALIRFAKILGIPVILTEHYPKGLGNTVKSVLDAFESLPKNEKNVKMEKVEFSCFQNEAISEKLSSLGVDTFVVMGIETHICVTQTCLDGLGRRYRMHVVEDACSSRKRESHECGIEKMRSSGCIVDNTEMVIYEMLKTSKHPKFKEVLEIVKGI